MKILLFLLFCGLDILLAAEKKLEEYLNTNDACENMFAFLSHNNKTPSFPKTGCQANEVYKMVKKVAQNLNKKDLYNNSTVFFKRSWIWMFKDAPFQQLWLLEFVLKSQRDIIPSIKSYQKKMNQIKFAIDPRPSFYNICIMVIREGKRNKLYNSRAKDFVEFLKNTGVKFPQGVDENIFNNVKTLPTIEYHLMLKAILNEDLELVEQYTKLPGFNINYVVDNNSGNTFLMYAYMNYKFSIARLLMEKDGIDLNAKNKFGKTAQDIRDEKQFFDIGRDAMSLVLNYLPHKEGMRFREINKMAKEYSWSYNQLVEIYEAAHLSKNDFYLNYIEKNYDLLESNVCKFLNSLSHQMWLLEFLFNIEDQLFTKGMSIFKKTFDLHPSFYNVCIMVIRAGNGNKTINSRAVDFIKFLQTKEVKFPKAVDKWVLDAVETLRPIDYDRFIRNLQNRFADQADMDSSLKMLVEIPGFNVNHLHSNDPLLKHIIRYRKTKLFHFFMQQDGVDVNILCSDGNSLLINLINVELPSLRSNRMIKLLFEHKNINVNSVDMNGKSVLVIVTEKIFFERMWDDQRDLLIETMKFLLTRKNIDVNKTDNQGNTALILAKKGFRVKPELSHKIVKLLMDNKNIDANIRNKDAITLVSSFISILIDLLISIVD